MKFIISSLELYNVTFHNIKFIVVSDDIDWCKKHLNTTNLEYDLVFSEGNSGCQDLAILAAANHSIITSGSSFGWWGAFLARGHVTYFPGWLKTGSWYNLPFREEYYFLPWWTKVAR